MVARRLVARAYSGYLAVVRHVLHRSSAGMVEFDILVLCGLRNRCCSCAPRHSFDRQYRCVALGPSIIRTLVYHALWMTTFCIDLFHDYANSPNQTLERTADRRENLLAMTSALKSDASLAVVSGRSACSR